MALQTMEYHAAIKRSDIALSLLMWKMSRNIINGKNKIKKSIRAYTQYDPTPVGKIIIYMCVCVFA